MESGEKPYEDKTTGQCFSGNAVARTNILENNPDPGQIAAAKDLFMRANWRCLDVQRSLMATEAEFTFLAADFAQNEK